MIIKIWKKINNQKTPVSNILAIIISPIQRKMFLLFDFVSSNNFISLEIDSFCWKGFKNLTVFVERDLKVYKFLTQKFVINPNA